MLDDLNEELLKAAIGLFEGDERAALDWLQKPAFGLGGMRPIDVEPNLAIRLIAQLEHGVYP